MYKYVILLLLCCLPLVVSAQKKSRYERTWQKIDSLERARLPKSALAEVEKLYLQIKTDGIKGAQQESEWLRALLYVNKYKSRLEERGVELAIARWESESAQAKGAARALMLSMLAEMYDNYLSENLYKVSERTNVATDVKQDNIQTWDVRRFADKIYDLYRQSLQEPSTRTIALADYAALLHSSDKREESNTQPYLYDLLAQRALAFYMSGKTHLTKPKYTFYVEQTEALASAAEFVQAKFSTQDSSSGEFQALLLFQDLLRFHANDKDASALVYIDFLRLMYMHKVSTLADKEARYLQQLERLEQGQPKTEIRAQVAHEIALRWQMRGKFYYPNNAHSFEHRWHLRKALELVNAALKKYTKQSVGRSNLLALKNSIEEKTFSFSTEQAVAVERPILVDVDYRNVEALHYRVIVQTAAVEEAMSGKYDEKAVAYLATLPAVQSGAWRLPQSGDYQRHSTEAVISGLKTGSYIVLVSYDEKFTTTKGNAMSHAVVYVSNISYVERDINGRRYFYLVHRVTGAPLQGVEAEFSVSWYDTKTNKYVWSPAGKAVSDKNGFMQAPDPAAIPNKSGSYKVIFRTKDGDELASNQTFAQYEAIREARVYRATYFFLDRAIYRPGQTVYFKGIMVSNDETGKNPKIMANQKTTISFHDANSQKVASVEVTTNEYGSYQGSFTAPAGGLTGYMHLLDGTTNSRKYFRVEEYKRPKFAVTMQPVDKSYKIGEAVKATGVATAFAGNAIDGARVQYRVRRVASYPYWNWRWGTQPYNAGQVIAFGETTTDANGKFSISFEALGDKNIAASMKPQFNYEVQADVTDAAGETRSAKSIVRVGYVAMTLNLNLSSNENISLEKGRTLRINSLNLNGQYEAAKGKIRIEQLQQPTIAHKKRYWDTPDTAMLSAQEFAKLFPNIAYGKEDDMRLWATKKEVHSADFDTEISKEIDLKALCGAWEQGTYRLTVLSADKYGEAIEQQYHFTLYSEKSTSMPTPQALYAQQNTYKAEVGDTVQVDFGAYDKEAWVLVQIEANGLLLLEEWVQPKGRKSIPIKIEEQYRGGIFVQLACVQQERVYFQYINVQVPYSNKELKIEYETFRDKLQPGQDEEWRIKISGSKGEQVAAEILAAMYDASLDAFAANSYGLSLWNANNAQYALRTGFGFSTGSASTWSRDFNVYSSTSAHSLARINWFGFSVGYYGRNNYAYMHDLQPDIRFDANEEAERPKTSAYARQDPPSPPPPPAPSTESTLTTRDNSANTGDGAADAGGDFGDVKVRTNLNETVFFFPQLTTDAQGNIILKFKMNEALTKWKFLLLAHTKDLATAVSTREVVTQKDLMVQPNAPRFFRQGDEIEFTAKISNLTDKLQKGKVTLQLFDASTMKPVDASFANGANTIDFSVEGNRSAGVSWKLKVPADWTSAITFRAIAKAGAFSDGEENSLPVVSNRMLVTETMPLPIRAGQTKTFNFTRMSEVSKSSTMRQHQYTLEFTQNPAWYAVQALPYLMEYPYECTEQIFSRFYANSLSSSIANAHPRIKQVFDQWKNIDPNALKSNLHKNQELKYALLEETPWVLAAESEEQQRRNIGLLFDLNRMADEQGKARDKMLDRQLSNGGFAWFPGGRDDWYMTQYIVEGMGHLRIMNVKAVTEDAKINAMNAKAVKYIDNQIERYYKDLMESIRRYKGNPEDDHLSHIAIHYLYARSFFLEIKVADKGTQEAIDYFEKQARKYWTNKSMYMQGMLSLAFHRKADQALPAAIVKSLKENSLNNEEMGMYWKYPSGYSWYELPIETHALMIEVFDEVAKDSIAVDDLKTWLLKAKQTTHWKTTKATAAACYALLRRGADFLAESKDMVITIADKPLDMASIQKEAGTGYFKKTWAAQDITPAMSKVVVTNPNKVVAWGAVYWQYFEQMDKITFFKETPLKINKQLFKEVRTNEGNKLVPISSSEKLKVGDLVKVRIEIFVDRDMEYVHLKDMRASGFEPVNVLSQYKYQGGLGYYESTRDLATHFFISYLSKGTYVFEYPLRVQHKGDFSNGITTMQCMYAPEFTTHSEGVRVVIE